MIRLVDRLMIAVEDLVRWFRPAPPRPRTVFAQREKPLNPSPPVQIGDVWLTPSGVLHRWDGNDWVEL